MVAYVHGIMVNFYYAVISYPVTLFVMGRVGGTKIEIADGFRTMPASRTLTARNCEETFIWHGVYVPITQLVTLHVGG